MCNSILQFFCKKKIFNAIFFHKFVISVWSRRNIILLIFSPLKIRKEASSEQIVFFYFKKQDSELPYSILGTLSLFWISFFFLGGGDTLNFLLPQFFVLFWNWNWQGRRKLMMKDVTSLFSLRLRKMLLLFLKAASFMLETF